MQQCVSEPPPFLTGVPPFYSSRGLSQRWTGKKLQGLGGPTWGAHLRRLIHTPPVRREGTSSRV
jgi:hypothetical protein